MMRLIHPHTGEDVTITRGQLPQDCSHCGTPLMGRLIFAAGGQSWAHIEHLEVWHAGQFMRPEQKLEEEKPEPRPARVHHRVVYNSTTTVNAFKDVCELEQAEGMALAYFVPLPGGVHYVAVFAEVAGWTP
jgi:hypothetical protein